MSFLQVSARRRDTFSLVVCLLPGLVALTMLDATELLAGEERRAETPQGLYEFSARVIWRSEGKTSKAQLFVKGDRYRIEHSGGVPTDLGFAGVTIVREDQQEVWYVLSQRRLFIAAPLQADDLLRFSIRLDGETDRTLIGDAMSGGRPAKLYEVLTKRHGRNEKFYQWVDAEHGLLLKILSQDRDWSVEYEHVVFSDQPEFYFEVPRGYQRIEAPEPEGERG